MPTYEYQCTACDERLEVEQRFSDAPLTTCPSCGGTLRKVYSAVGVVFKGSGFYKTDSRSTSSKASSGGSGTDSASTSSSESSEKTSADSSGSTSPTPATATSATPASASSSSDS